MLLAFLILKKKQKIQIQILNKDKIFNNLFLRTISTNIQRKEYV